MCIKPCHTAPLITNVKNVTNAIPTFFCFVDVRLKVLLMSFHGRYNTTIQTGTYPSDIVDSFFHSAGIPNTNCSRHSYHLHFKRNNWHILFMCDSSSFLEEKNSFTSGHNKTRQRVHFRLKLKLVSITYMFRPIGRPNCQIVLNITYKLT